MKQYVIGVDFGSDSVRALLVDAGCGETAAGIYPSLPAAQEGMAAGIAASYIPSEELSGYYGRRYERYRRITEFTERNSNF